MQILYNNAIDRGRIMNGRRASRIVNSFASLGGVHLHDVKWKLFGCQTRSFVYLYHFSHVVIGPYDCRWSYSITTTILSLGKAKCV